ncbi:VanW family protein [Candidatus Parcubacteria bacterium]|nr:VanW family protein [Candidatus Parcubacteria bacterium]
MKFNKQKIILLVLTITSLLVLVFVINFVLDENYKDKFYPGVKINGVSLSGLSLKQAEKIFQSKLDGFQRDGQTFVYQNKTVKIYPIANSVTSDLAREIITFDLNSTLNSTYRFGRGKNFFDSLWQKIKMIFVNKNFSLQFNLDEIEIKKILTNNFQELEKPGNNPQLEFSAKDGPLQNNGQASSDWDNFTISQGKSGLIFDYNLAINNLKKNLSQLNFEIIELKLKLSQPEFNKEQTKFLEPQIKEILTLKKIEFYTTSTSEFEFPYKIFTVFPNEFKNWLNLAWNKESKQVKLIFESVKVEEYLNTVKWRIEQPVKEAKFGLINNRVSEFQSSQAGYQIDLEKTLANLELSRVLGINNKKNTAQIVVQKTKPQTNIADINDLGINELIGIGASIFAGSPINRRHNIKVGAQSLNGLLLAPGEEFSTNNALGEINAARGYLPELVIKGNQTIPEYGGGLCQIATTLFRLAINSGLKITARKPHAYRVSYYEPAGTDATIYPPWPDLRFINDTPNYLLFQTHVQDNDLRFEFWGTNDGRQVATTTPKVWNFTSPGETKYVETTDLEPEKIKCIEIAHNGAEAEFSRTISYPNSDKEPEIESWYSKYRPWQAVCLIGVDPSKLATSTEVVVE